MTAPAPAGPTATRWVTAALLDALARYCVVEGGMLTAPQLAEWTQATLTPQQRVHATTRLCALEFMTHSVRIIGGERVDCYLVTAAGAQAIEQAATGLVRKSGPKTTREPNPVRATDLSTRLWALLRMRRKLDTDDAARTLCTAGEQDFARVRETVARTLRRWELAGAIEAAKKRIKRAGDAPSSNGSKAYVLVHDSGPTPPRWRQALKSARATAQGGAR